MSSDEVASATPVIPPNTNRNMKPKKYRTGVVTQTAPCRSVEVHVNTLIAEKIAVNIDRNPNAPTSNVDIPATNMWWPQVKKPMNAMPREDTAIARYDAGGLWLNVHTTSLTTPIAGRIMMYTAGWESVSYTHLRAHETPEHL